jgi:hypothetical protein
MQTTIGMHVSSAGDIAAIERALVNALFMVAICWRSSITVWCSFQANSRRISSMAS